MIAIYEIYSFKYIVLPFNLLIFGGHVFPCFGCLNFYIRGEPITSSVKHYIVYWI